MVNVNIENIDDEYYGDGICNLCGSIVIETSLEPNDPIEFIYCDYKTKCINPNCIENNWHYVCDQVHSTYYTSFLASVHRK